MKFFDENNKYTEEALYLDTEVSKLLRPVYDKYIEMGYGPREISHIISLANMDTEVETILTQKDNK